MINWSRIKQNSLVGRLLRLPLKLIPSKCVLPVFGQFSYRIHKLNGQMIELDKQFPADIIAVKGDL